MGLRAHPGRREADEIGPTVGEHYEGYRAETRLRHHRAFGHCPGVSWPVEPDESKENMSGLGR